jgi:hypothetical protein
LGDLNIIVKYIASLQDQQLQYLIYTAILLALWQLLMNILAKENPHVFGLAVSALGYSKPVSIATHNGFVNAAFEARTER